MRTAATVVSDRKLRIGKHRAHLDLVAVARGRIDEVAQFRDGLRIRLRAVARPPAQPLDVVPQPVARAEAVDLRGIDQSQALERGFRLSGVEQDLRLAAQQEHGFRVIEPESALRGVLCDPHGVERERVTAKRRVRPRQVAGRNDRAPVRLAANAARALDQRLLQRQRVLDAAELVHRHRQRLQRRHRRGVVVAERLARRRRKSRR